MVDSNDPLGTDDASPLDSFPSERNLDAAHDDTDLDEILEEFSSETTLADAVVQPSSTYRVSPRRLVTGRAVAVAAAVAAIVVLILGSYLFVRDADRLPVPSPVQRAGSGDQPGQVSGQLPQIEGRINPPRAATNEPLRSPASAFDSALVALVRGADVGNLPAYSPSFDARGDTILFHTGRQGATSLLAATLGRNGSIGDLAVLMQDGASNYHVQESPDGRWIAFDSDRDGTRGVYVAARNGLGQARRVSGDGYGAIPRWSPDGARLAFIRAEPGRPKVWNIWTLTLATGSLDRLTSSSIGQPWGASWFPDSRRIAYSREDQLIVLDTATGGKRVFSSPLQRHLVRTPAVAPDGSRIVFQIYRDGTWVLDLMRGSMRRILKDPSAEEFAWSPDGTAIAFHSHRNGEWDIWKMMLPS